MVLIRFFASIREAAGMDRLEVELPEQTPLNIEQLIEYLKIEQPRIHTILSTSKPLVAVNQTMSNLSSAIEDGDELAFFPPMTGG